eukprot:CAMPEP_0113845966 /NCGR_PEP_ID=MMETSP0372-20130328/1044_1 /TAXON_ID=340204 /ORGANISM="Lankesteria abbotti" /LENGTH=243 /DNA_ID=CAMNT_0000815055 /DNA_START=69 /DNA_END=798 /DNA_ORIENTATION=+ /assembly_acc=CAM_ASM_000359
MVVYKDSLVIFGGRDQRKIMLRDVWKFDICGKNWCEITVPGSDMQNVPYVTMFHSADVIGDRMFTFGGDGLHCFDLEQEAWKKVDVGDCSPTPRTGHASAVWQGKLHIFGGSGDGLLLDDDHWEYEPNHSDGGKFASCLNVTLDRASGTEVLSLAPPGLFTGVLAKQGNSWTIYTSLISGMKLGMSIAFFAFHQDFLNRIPYKVIFQELSFQMKKEAMDEDNADIRCKEQAAPKPHSTELTTW